MIKVLHIVYSFNVGGLETGVVKLINGLPANNFDHEICCITSSGASAHRLIRKSNIYELNKKVGNDLRIIPKVIRIIKYTKCHIVHTRNWGTIDGVIAARLAGGVSIIHGEHGWNMDDPLGRSRRRLWIRKILSPFVDRFVAVSEDIRQWMITSAGISEKKITKIINGVDTERFRPGSGGELRRFHDEIVVGAVGRLDPIKRYDVLLKAFSALNHEQHHLRLLIIGGGPEYSRLETIARNLPFGDRIVLLGERDDVSRLYNEMDIFVQPSQNEGISNTILEAMSSGLPVVATNVGGNPELVDTGVTGTLVDVGDADAIRKGIAYYLHYPVKMREHGVNGREAAVKDFSIARMISEYETLYRTVASRR